MPKPSLRVVPNPYRHIDHNGYPAAAFPRDFQSSAGRRLYVGASLDREAAVVHERRGEGDPRAPTRETNRWRFRLEPVDIEDTPHHRMGIRSGSLLPADERTHRLVLKSAKYIGWETRLEEAKTKAVAMWKREHSGDEPAFLSAPSAAAATKKETK